MTCLRPILTGKVTKPSKFNCMSPLDFDKIKWHKLLVNLIMQIYFNLTKIHAIWSKELAMSQVLTWYSFFSVVKMFMKQCFKLMEFIIVAITKGRLILGNTSSNCSHSSKGTCEQKILQLRAWSCASSRTPQYFRHYCLTNSLSFSKQLRVVHCIWSEKVI